MVIDEGLEIIQVHTQKLLHTVTYFGFKRDLEKFKKLLGKDRVMFESPSEAEDLNDSASIETNHEDISDGSSTSPFKKIEAGSSKSLDDSGIVVDPGAGTSFVKKKLDVYDFNETMESIQDEV